MAKKSSLRAEKIVQQLRASQRERARIHRGKLKEKGLKSVSVVVPATHEQVIKETAKAIRALAEPGNTVVSLTVPTRYEELLVSIAAAMVADDYDSLEKLSAELVVEQNKGNDEPGPFFPEI